MAALKSLGCVMRWLVWQLLIGVPIGLVLYNAHAQEKRRQKEAEYRQLLIMALEAQGQTAYVNA
eukprot:1088019-Pyramimonas_sp.AAC.1